MKRTSTLPLIVTTLIVAGGCGSSGGSFEAGAATAPLTCMRHQKNTPAKSFADDTARTFTLLRYYTANGSRPYCDHRPATGTDKAWARLYAKLSGNPHPVAAILR